VVRFLGGEELRTYRDDAFGQDGDGFRMLRWNREMQRYDRLLVPLHTLKGIFNVKAWPEAARSPSLTVVNGPIQAQASPPGESAMLTPLLPRFRDAVVDLPDADLASRDPKVFEAALGRHIDTLLARVGVETTSTPATTSEKQRRQVAGIRDGAARLSDRVEDILALTSVASRPEAHDAAAIDARSLLEPFAR